MALRVAMLAACLTVTSFCLGQEPAEDSPEPAQAAGVLRSRGLVLSGQMFVLEGEKEVIERASRVADARAALIEASGRCDEINAMDAAIAEVDARRLDLTRFIDACYIRMDSVNPFNDTRQSQIYNDAKNASIRARSERQALDVKADQMRRNQPSLSQRRVIQGEYERRVTEFARSVAMAKAAVGPTNSAYASIVKDPEISASLADLRKATGKPYKIGPSYPYTQAVQEIGLRAPVIKRSKGMVKTKK